jgi:hypothetical protein
MTLGLAPGAAILFRTLRIPSGDVRLGVSRDLNPLDRSEIAKAILIHRVKFSDASCL